MMLADRLTFHIFVPIARFERDWISERTKKSLAFVRTGPDR